MTFRTLWAAAVLAALAGCMTSREASYGEGEVGAVTVGGFGWPPVTYWVDRRTGLCFSIFGSSTLRVPCRALRRIPELGPIPEDEPHLPAER